MKTKQTEFYKKWWFWVIVGFVLLGVISSFSGSDYQGKTYEAEYLECKQSLKEINEAWIDYKIALNNYCALDYNNPICIALTG